MWSPLLDSGNKWVPMVDSWNYNDGGRKDAGYRGETRDCVVRSIAICTGIDYQQVYDDINGMAKAEKPKPGNDRSSARLGVHKPLYKRYLRNIGWVWTPTMFIGSGCRVHLHSDELPAGALIVSVSKHLTAVVDGIIQDTYDCSRDGARCVYGFWRKG